MNFNLSLAQTQKLVMTPELKQAIEILQFNSLELNEFIVEELLNNPILQKNEASLSRFFQSVPFAKAPFLKDSYHDDGAWLFFGYNPAQEVNNEGKQEEEEQETIIIIVAGNSVIILIAVVWFFILRRKKTKS